MKPYIKAVSDIKNGVGHYFGSGGPNFAHYLGSYKNDLHATSDWVSYRPILKTLAFTSQAYDRRQREKIFSVGHIDLEKLVQELHLPMYRREVLWE